MEIIISQDSDKYLCSCLTHLMFIAPTSYIFAMVTEYLMCCNYLLQKCISQLFLPFAVIFIFTFNFYPPRASFSDLVLACCRCIIVESPSCGRSSTSDKHIDFPVHLCKPVGVRTHRGVPNLSAHKMIKERKKKILLHKLMLIISNLFLKYFLSP